MTEKVVLWPDAVGVSRTLNGIGGGGSVWFGTLLFTPTLQINTPQG